MQNLCFRYTQWVNSRQKRVGHLFQGRYKAIVVDADTYLAELVRYIHFNPVQAKLVKTPEDYSWSVHKAYMDHEKLPWLTTEWVLSQFAQRLKTARTIYDKFVQYGRDEGHRQEFHSGTSEGRILGNDTFVERVYEKSEDGEKKSVTLDEILDGVSQVYGLTEEEMVSGGKRRYNPRPVG